MSYDACDEKVPASRHQDLKSYQVASLVHEMAEDFGERFLARNSRIHARIRKAAQEGRRRIVAGCKAAGTSRWVEMRFLGEARESLGELLEDVLGFLQRRRLPVWDKNHPNARAVRALAYSPDRSYDAYRGFIDREDPEVAANALACLIHQANYLLDRQRESLERRVAFRIGAGR